MASGGDVVRLTHKQLQTMAKKYENDAAYDTAEKKSTERQRKIRPERPIYVPGQSRLSSQQRSNCAELSDTERNSPLRDIPETSQTTLARESDLRSRSTPPVPNDMHKFSDGQANISADLAPPGRPGKVKSEDERAQSRSAHAVARQQVKTRQQPVSETFRHEDRSQSRDKSSSSDCRETTPVAETAGGERKRGKKPDLKRYEPKLRQSQYMADGDDRTSGSLPDRPAEYRQSTMDSSVSGRQFHGPIERPAQHTLEQMYEPKASKGGNVSVAGARKQIQSENVTTKGKQISGTQVDVQARGKTPPAEHLGNSSESLPKERRTGRKSRHNKRSNNQNVKQADEFPQITTELTDDKENAFEQTVEAECESEDEQMEWDYKGDLQINIDGALPVLNWGDIPPPPSDDEWSDEDSCSDAKPTIIPGVKPQRKKSSRKRKKRLKAKQQAQAIDNLTQDVKSDAHPVADIPANDDKWQDETGLDDYRTELESASVARKFEGLVVTNSLSGSSKPSRVDKSQGPKDRHDGSRGTSGVVSVSKSYSKARQQRDQRKQKGNDVGRDVKMNMEANRHERHKPEKSDKILNNNGARGPNMQSGYNNHQRASEGAVTSGKVGGIIHLPVGTSTLTPGESGPEALGLPSSHGRRGQNHARGGRGQGNRTLWDPKHPDANPVASRSRQDSYRSGVSESSNASADHSVYPAPNHPAYQMGTAAYPVEYAPYCQQQSPTRGFYYHDFSPGHAMPVDGYVYAYPAVGYEGAAYPEELYRQGLYGQEDGSGQARANRQMRVDHLIQQASAFDVQLSNLLSRRMRGEEGFKHVMTLRVEIQRRLQEALLVDVELSNKKNIEQMLWKSVFYQVIEMLRHQIAEGSDSDAKQQLMTVLDDGVAFYEATLRQLQSAHGFSVDAFVDQSGLTSEIHLGRTAKLALVSCQRIMICLGDLARYREQANHTANYGRARSWYTKAQKIAPKNGRPYNQLAILALYTGRKLDAVYYYMRSLAASNPFLTARESLMQLFEDAAKKAETLEQKRKDSAARRKRKAAETAARRRRNSLGQGQRVEIWIAHDGQSSSENRIELDDEDDDSDDINSLPMVEVNKSFILDFLRVHGKLFTKIGMENFPEVCGRMLREFDIQLNHNPSPISNTRLIQLMAINMFTVDNTELKGSQLDENCRSLLQEHAVQLGLDMFALLAVRCTSVLRNRAEAGSVDYRSGDCDDSLKNILPGLKAWSDWMTCHVHLWNPPPLTLDPELGPNVDVWQSMANLFNILNKISISSVKLSMQPSSEGSKAIILPEDVELAGFVPLLSLSYSPLYTSSDCDIELARDCVRISKLRLFADYLCGIDPPLMSYNVETRQYVSAVPSLPATSRTEAHQKSEDGQRRISELGAQEDANDDIIVEAVEEEFVASGSSHTAAQEDAAVDDISALKARREELSKKLAEQTKIRENIKAAIDISHQEYRAIQLEIRPIYLVPDTNCFIDHLFGIQRLLALRKFTIIVPLVVINELDGLSKGCRDRQYEFAEHADMVRTGARAAMGFLEKEFESRNSSLRALTSEGTVMDTIAFRSEQSKDVGKNDDLILSCCLHYCQDKARDFMPKSQDEPIRLQRNVILLTNDRNLRLKAHMHNVPTKNIPAFLHWAGIR